ncbi:MAG TPA: response regulator [Planctomycetaceae bacterium]|nr:response regulator [Planctomycetaceae bacterium]
MARILVAEDGPDNQRLLAWLLLKAGLESTLASNGRDAVSEALAAHAAGRPFDLILMDLQMPVVDGFAATAALRGAGYERPIVALSADTSAVARERCLDAGCDACVAKPIDRGELLATVRRFLAASLPARDRRTQPSLQSL